jgi:hypothetical protein
LVSAADGCARHDQGAWRRSIHSKTRVARASGALNANAVCSAAFQLYRLQVDTRLRFAGLRLTGAGRRLSLATVSAASIQTAL